MLSIAGLLACLACGGDASSPALVATPSDVAFGDVYLGGSTSRTITLTNTSGQALTITDVNSTGSALVTSGDALPLTLTPGESTSLAVELVPSATGNVVGAVTVTSDDPVNPTIVNHLAKGVLPSSLVTAAPAAIAFGQVAVGDRAFQNVTVTNGSARDVIITNLVATGSGVAASVPALPFTLRSRESATVAVAFAPTAVGAVTGSVALRSDQPHPEAVIELSGSAVVSAPPVSVIANPTTLAFGDVTVGSFSARTVTLTNLSAEPVAISALGTTGAGFSVSGLSLPATLSPGTSATLTMRFTPTEAGGSSGTLAVQSPSSADPLSVIDYSATGVPFASITSVTARDATVVASGSVQMVADVAATGTIDKSVTWSLDGGAPGSVNATTGLYTAPATPGSYRVWATSNADPSKKGFGTVTVSAPPQSVSISVSPTSASLAAGATQAFTSTVTAATNMAVIWSVQEGAAGGSISPAGVYTAPATAGTYHVVATSSADSSKKASATITVTAPAPMPTAVAGVSASPANVAFDSVYVGQKRTYPVVVRNASGGSLTISSVQVTGGGISHGLALPRTIENGASAWFSVTFAPTSAGNAAGSIELKNDGGATLLSLPITGTGASLDASNSVSVVAYGAQGNGVTDDTAAFRAAAAAAGAGKVLYVPQPPGGQHYRLTRVVQIYGSVVGEPGSRRPEIRMYGADGTDTPGGAPPNAIFYYVNNTAGTVITGLHLNGGRYFAPHTNVYGMAEFSHALMLLNVSNVHVENNLIENTQGDNILIGGAAGTPPCVNVKIIANVLRHAMRCSIFPGDTRGLRVYLNTISEVVEYQGAIDFEPNTTPQANWDAEVAYNDFDVTKQHDHLILLSNYATGVPAPGGNIRVHDNWGQSGPYGVYRELVYPGTTSAFSGVSIQASLPAAP